MTIRPAVSTPPVIGDACTPPSARVVSRIMWWRGRANSSSASRSTAVVGAMVLGMSPVWSPDGLARSPTATGADERPATVDGGDQQDGHHDAVHGRQRRIGE